MRRSFIIEGIDRLGKSTLIEGIQNRLGYFQVIHYQKPKVLECYEHQYGTDSKKMYQIAAFRSMFNILNSDARIILDRAHLGEMVYAPIYRGYSGSYVFDLERSYAAFSRLDHVRMILLTENFDISTHFVDDGESFDASKRKEEQNLFIEAFNKSIIKDKKIICVTSEDGNFRCTEDILEEAIS